MSLSKITINNNTTVYPGIVYDISEATGRTYIDLADALSSNGQNVPENVRKGGMSICFIQTDTNKYVQYRLMSSSWSIILKDWINVDYEIEKIVEDIYEEFQYEPEH